MEKKILYLQVKEQDYKTDAVVETLSQINNLIQDLSLINPTVRVVIGTEPSEEFILDPIMNLPKKRRDAIIAAAKQAKENGQ